MLRLARILSLDVAIGAGLMSWLLSRFWQVNVPFYYFSELSLLVWIIYTADHLIDGRNIDHPASTPRHRFHQKYFKVLLPVLGLALLVFVFNIPEFVTRDLWISTSVLFGCIVLYFFSLVWARKTHYKYVFKELFIAFGYTAGVALAPLSYAWEGLTLAESLILVRVFNLALGNLFIFSLVDYPQDLRDENPSVVKILGEKGVGIIISSLLSISFVLGIFRYAFADSIQIPVLVTISAMELTLLLVYVFRRRLKKDEWYRLLGDGIFLFPLVLWLYERFQ